MQWIAACRLLSVDDAAVADSVEYVSNDSSPRCAASCHPSKWKGDSRELEGLIPTLYMVFSTAGSGGKIWLDDIL